MKITYTAKVRVRYADTDQMGVVYYGKYFEYFEVARTEMLRSIGLPYRTIEEQGFQLPVLEASARYYKGATYDDLLAIECTMDATVRPKLEISYRILLDGSQELLATGATTLAFIDATTGKPARPPMIYREAIERTHTEQTHAEYAPIERTEAIPL